MKKYYDYPLKKHNTFGVQSYASVFVEYYNLEELKTVLRSLDPKTEEGTQHPDFLFLGGGSNLLFTKDFDGTIIHGNIQGIEVIGENEDSCYVRVGAAVIWDDFVEWTIEHNLYGIENLSLIPGETGASAVQNIGAYGVEVSDVIDKVETVCVDDCSDKVFTNSECHYSYRKSLFKENYNHYVVHHVVYRLKRTFVPNLGYKALQQEFSGKSDGVKAIDIRNFVIKMRQGKLPDPEEIGNAGSFFMNPIVSCEKFTTLQSQYPSIPYYKVGNRYKIPAAWLIEKCGWKGRKIGNVGVYPKQPLVIVNYGKALAKDIVDFSQYIIDDVMKHFQIELQREVQFV